MLKDIDANRAYITTPEAARRSGLTRIYLARLLREGKLEGFQLAREWFIYIDSLEQFLATPRKSGPKGPFNKPKRQSSDTTSTKNESNNA
jgi:excisionase family DNA binding protein